MQNEMNNAAHIGEKIRKMRLKAGLTQTELAGDFITRNMLSCIENGAALPSLPTLLRIAEKLSISPGYFLSGEEEAGQYRKLSLIPKIRAFYHGGQYEEALSLCRELALDDEEISEIIFSCLMKLGDKARGDHRLSLAASYYCELLSIPAEKLYLADRQRDDAAFYLAMMASVTEKQPLGKVSSAPDDWAPLLTATELLAEGNADAARCIRASGLITDPEKLHYLDALVSVEDGDYLAAIPALQTITSAAKPDFYIYYHALEKLEFCYEAMENYKDAYSISKRRASLEEKFREQ